MKHVAACVIVGFGVLLAAPLARAHFKLIEPASWLVEDERGNPQKLGLCGGTSADPGTPSGAVTAVQGGQPLHIAVQETVFHPGHYRVALSVSSRDELPQDPEVVTRDTERGPWSVSADIQDPVRPPVLADGLFAHTERAAGMWETDITLPNINCQKCTLQIIQFMAEHGYNQDGGYSYHHCADLDITADPSKPVDSGWPAQ